MDQEFAIAVLISDRQRQLGISNGNLLRRIGYLNAGKGMRRIEALFKGDLDKTKFILDALPAALELPPDQVTEAIAATQHQLAEEERLRLEEEDRRYRAAFRPHALWETENEVPRPLFVVAFVGVERFLRFDFDLTKGEDSFVDQALAALPSEVALFGKTKGFTVNYSPDRRIDYDTQGNMVAAFTRARRPGWADLTLRGDDRSLLPLFGVKAPERYER